ncbi:MAG: hypothetical protein ACTJLL_02335 [Anaplasma sp.]
MSEWMKKETCGWMGIFCIAALWVGGAVYFVLDFRGMLQNSALYMEKLERENSRISAELASISAEMTRIRSSIPKQTIIVDKEGCVRPQCLARTLLLVADLRRSFSLGAMSHDAVFAVKPVLEALDDKEIDDSMRVVERFNPRRGYRDLKEELAVIKGKLRVTMAGKTLKHMSKWIVVENRNNPIWKEFELLERLVERGAWEESLAVANGSVLSSVPGMQSWVRDLELILNVERSLLKIYEKLIERVNRNPGDI